MNETNEKYFALLEKGMLDKVWFLEKIEHSVNTLVDFGCGDGSLFTIIDRIYPGRFRYIGIDHDEKMIALAKENGIEIYSSLDELPEIDYGKSNIFSQDDLKAAVVSIKCQFAFWDGCTLKSIR